MAFEYYRRIDCRGNPIIKIRMWRDELLPFIVTTLLDDVVNNDRHIANRMCIFGAGTRLSNFKCVQSH